MDLVIDDESKKDNGIDQEAREVGKMTSFWREAG